MPVAGSSRAAFFRVLRLCAGIPTLVCLALLVFNWAIDTDHRFLPPGALPEGEMERGVTLITHNRTKNPVATEGWVRWQRPLTKELAEAESARCDRPESGIFAHEIVVRTAPIIVDARAMPTDVQMMLFWCTPRRGGEFHVWHTAVFVRKGEILRGFVPEGACEILAVTGDRWYGEALGLFPGGVGRYLGSGYSFGGITQQVAAGERNYSLTRRPKEYAGFSFEFMPFKDGSPGFRSVRMKKIKPSEIRDGTF